MLISTHRAEGGGFLTDVDPLVAPGRLLELEVLQGVAVQVEFVKAARFRFKGLKPGLSSPDVSSKHAPSYLAPLPQKPSTTPSSTCQLVKPHQALDFPQAAAKFPDHLFGAVRDEVLLVVGVDWLRGPYHTGCQRLVPLTYADHTGCQQPVCSTKHPTRVTPRGGQIGYAARTGCDQLVRRMQKMQKNEKLRQNCFGQPHTMSVSALYTCRHSSSRCSVRCHSVFIMRWNSSLLRVAFAISAITAPCTPQFSLPVASKTLISISVRPLKA
jgi:hypothetical protein